MTLSAKVRTHKLSSNATLCTSGYNQVGADSPAIEAMTDFSRVHAVTISAAASLPEANATMISRGVRLLMVVSADEEVLGLITARDILGERPLQLAQARNGKRDDLTVRDLMCPLANIDTLYLNEVMHARVIDILNALKNQGRQHIMVEDVDPATGLPRVRGIFSATQIGRLLGVPVLGFELASTFAEIEAALAN
ncbi:CBS domain-containing protein [Quatrionicoccus australiensis]|uniref:CBS domain-containing protein n=1 Tax=Quatrionicoccus australiensis TaxID=138118 RepID=UPI001CF86B4C|nr:CBS domain-containing protein [Quatrionicoccus australiensis]UCV14788.1 CBS domain-containing protein [Quatrionicoccus australiensis]